MARLLIVDDHRSFITLLDHALSGFGHEVVGHCWRATRCCRPPRRATTLS